MSLAGIRAVAGFLFFHSSAPSASHKLVAPAGNAPRGTAFCPVIILSLPAVPRRTAAPFSPSGSFTSGGAAEFLFSS